MARGYYTLNYITYQHETRAYKLLIQAKKDVDEYYYGINSISFIVNLPQNVVEWAFYGEYTSANIPGVEKSQAEMKLDIVAALSDAGYDLMKENRIYNKAVNSVQSYLRVANSDDYKYYMQDYISRNYYASDLLNTKMNERNRLAGMTVLAGDYLNAYEKRIVDIAGLNNGTYVGRYAIVSDADVYACMKGMV